MVSNRDPLKVLVVDDEAAMREVLEARLSNWGYQVELAACGAAAKEIVRTFEPHVVVSDLVLPDLTGLDLLSALQVDDAERFIILITAYGNIDNAVSAMKRGARDFLTKPLDYAALRALLQQAESEWQSRQTRQRQARQRDVPAPAGRAHALEPQARAATGPLLVGASTSHRRLMAMIEKVSRSEGNVLITGESGTGKELVARTIHDLGARKSGPFVAVNAAAIPEGLTEAELMGYERGAFTGAVSTRTGFYEQADGGTLFLDEITEMPPALQAKLLRVLEDGRVRRLGASRERRCDVRVLAASNRDPQQAIVSGVLREDLYYRLNMFTVHVEPLRRRPADVPVLVEYFLEQFRRRYEAAARGVSAETMADLQAYGWPGNVRQLRNVVERAAHLASGDVITRDHLPPEIMSAETPNGEQPQGIVIPPDTTSAEAERILILETLKRTNNNKAEAARRLGLDVKTIRNKLKSFDTSSIE